MSEFYDLKISNSNADSGVGLIASRTSYSNFEFPRHFHSFYTILGIENGVNEGFTNNTAYLLDKGHMLFINPGDIHAGKSFNKKHLSFSSLLVEEDYFLRRFEENELNYKGHPVFSIHPVKHNLIFDSFQLLVRSISEKESTEEISACEYNFLVAILDLELNAAQPSKKEDKTRGFLYKARRYIQLNHSESFSLKMLANDCLVSPFHLLREFKSAFGLTPFEYLKVLRVERSKDLIKSCESMTDVAYESGFFDQSHFNRTFKRVTGLTPTQFKSSIS